MVSVSIDKNICEWLEKAEDEIIDFCCKLISYKSVTGKEEEIQFMLYEFLQKELEPDYLSMLEVEKKRPNVIAVWNNAYSKEKGILLNAHVDVVDVGKNELLRWRNNPWEPQIRNGRIYGRGSSDMKAGITSILWALKSLKKFNIKPKKPIGLELVVGEELMEHEIGTTAATKKLKEEGYNFDFAIIPEPTNLEIHTVSPGAFVLEIEVTGYEIHDGVRNLILYPQPWGVPCGTEVGVDAIEKIVVIYNALRELERSLIMRWRHRILGGGGYPEGFDLQGIGSLFNMNIALIEGGTYVSSVPGYAKITANCYYPPMLSFDNVKKIILKKIDSIITNDDWLTLHPPKVSFSMLWPPYETDVENHFCQELARSLTDCGKKAIFSGFRAVSDVSFLQQLGINGVCFGPGDLSMNTHGPNEYVPITQIIDCAKVIATFLLKL